jgi:hypothetical protein
MYPACKIHVLYCHLWPVRLYTIFSHYLMNSKISEKVTEHKMRVLIFSTTFVWNISQSKKNPARYYDKCTYIYMWSTHYSCQALMKLEFSQQIFKKYSYQISWKSIQWEPSCSIHMDGWTETHYDPNNCFLQFCKHRYDEANSLFLRVSEWRHLPEY